jgi:cytochrome c biogenesis protein CcmG/thiol:disulfide interchange protein DsbE
MPDTALRWLFLLPLVLFLTIALAAGWLLMAGADPHRLPSTLIDQPAPAFELPPLPGVDRPGLAQADLVGAGPKLVNVFASWCVPCRVEHPLLLRLAEEGTVPVYGINWKDKAEDAANWIAELGNPYARIGHDPSGRAGIDWGVYGVPETYVIDAEGRIRYKHVGPLMAKDLDETVLPMLRSLQP